MSTNTEFSACFVTVPNEDVGKKLAYSIVEGKLAACVNILPQVKSIYVWESKIQEDSELILMIKTQHSKVPALIEHVKQNHPYSVPEVIELPILQGNPAYLKWITDSVEK
ncbi:unnamed protein product [Didymodactylos carnosus]|uniref:Divalent-cation tolerance protein CutA n=1 Tax=Didymodactylos carnosus TaxID=1234261 RepID=A0A814CUS3_9BILA|nr:unnamed protein product [Didymodactylos carnosus]CAF0944963.1 unnamed protein product [Didymodactylos carnosus]CAF3661301.1 unnamed protein product [Didymodactylos carnosus]CAF3721214.1 unnamed protein product [Didymodactylos carnosus]